MHKSAYFPHVKQGFSAIPCRHAHGIGRLSGSFRIIEFSAQLVFCKIRFSIFHQVNKCNLMKPQSKCPAGLLPNDFLLFFLMKCGRCFCPSFNLHCVLDIKFKAPRSTTKLLLTSTYSDSVNTYQHLRLILSDL